MRSDAKSGRAVQLHGGEMAGQRAKHNGAKWEVEQDAGCRAGRILPEGQGCKKVKCTVEGEKRGERGSKPGDPSEAQRRNGARSDDREGHGIDEQEPPGADPAP